MSDNDEDVSTSGIEKKFRWEDAAGTSSAVPTSTRWSAATPRQYGTTEATPRGVGGGGYEGVWRGFSTPSATPLGAEEVGTPRFGLDQPGVSSSNLMYGQSTPSQHSTMLAGGTTPRMMSIGGATPAYGGQTPRVGAGGVIGNTAFGATPSYQFEGTTPMQSHYVAGGATSGFGDRTQGDGVTATTAIVEEKKKQLEKEWRLKNKRLTVEFLDEFLPSSEYFEKVDPPPSYNPVPPEEPNFYEAAIKVLSESDMMSEVMGGGPTTYEIPDSLGPGMPEMPPADAGVFVELLQFAGKEESIPPTSIISYMLMKNLFKIKNGDTQQRRTGTRYLLEKSAVFGPKLIFGRVFVIWSANILNIQQKHYFIEFCKALISKLGVSVRTSCKEIIHTMEPLLSEKESVIREDGRQVLILLARVAGFHTVWDTIQPDFSHKDNTVRRHTAKFVALIAFATGMEDTIEALTKLSLDPSLFTRQTTARALGEICTIVGHAVVSSLSDIVPILERLLRDERRVSREAALAVAMIAEVCASFGREEMTTVIHLVCEECRKNHGNTAGPFIRAFGSLLPLMSPEEARSRTATMIPLFVSQFHTQEDEYQRIMLTVVRRCINADGITADFIREVLLEPFFDGFWKVQRLAVDRKTSTALISCTVAMARKIGSVDVLLKLSKDMKDDNDVFQRLVMHGVRRVVSAAGMEDVTTALAKNVLEKAISAVDQDESGGNKVAMDTLAAICNSLGARLKPFLKDVFRVIQRRRESVLPAVRTQAAELTARIARTVLKADGTIFLQELSSSLFTRMEDDNPMALSANLRATRVLLEVLGSSKYVPSVRELLKKLTFVIKNTASSVRQNAVALIEVIATHFDADVDAIHLHQLATKGLFDLLDGDRREIRRICARTFGVIASKISPFAIILELVDNFRQDKRKIRICTAVALGAIAKMCGPFTVLPYILNEFQVSENEQVAVIVQHAVLKAIRYIFEAIGSGGEDYVYACLPLLQRALTETSIQMRRMAIEASRAILMAVAGLDGFEGVAIHLLNFVHPNIVELLSKKEVKVAEERLKLISAVVSFYEAARFHVGSGTLYRYLVQGLFHPARLVRDIYRRAYNIVYLASPEELVPHYALVENDAEFPSLQENGEEVPQPIKRYFRYEVQVPF